MKNLFKKLKKLFCNHEFENSLVFHYRCKKCGLMIAKTDYEAAMKPPKTKEN